MFGGKIDAIKVDTIIFKLLFISLIALHSNLLSIFLSSVALELNEVNVMFHQISPSQATSAKPPVSMQSCENRI